MEEPPVFGRHKPRLPHLISLVGLGEFAYPGEAHGGYDGTAEILKERRTWLETIEE